MFLNYKTSISFAINKNLHSRRSNELMASAFCKNIKEFPEKLNEPE